MPKPPPTPRPANPSPADPGEIPVPIDSGPDPWEVDAIRAIRESRERGGPGSEASAQGAWASILTHYQDRLYAICFRMVRDPETAADLTQDTLVKVINGFDSFDSRARLSTWMTRIAINVCLSHIRKQKLRSHASLDAPAAGSGGEEGGGGSWGNGLAQEREPEARRRVEQDEARETVLRALAELEPDHRAVLVLRDLRGLDYQEIAAALDVPVGTVKSRIFRARSALREAVEADQARRGFGQGAPGSIEDH